jgi:predicted amidohydrolase YtcJ
MPPEMEGELDEVVRILAANRWPWRLHATYDETISRALDVFERVKQDIPLSGLHWFFDHAETISDESIERIAALGGGIAVQHRMAYQGEYFVERYGLGAAAATPPITRMIAAGVKVSAGTDATRVASYNPWVALAWLVTGKTVAGFRLYPPGNCLDRETALRMWTENVTWFSDEEGKKGRIQTGQFADLIVPDRDYFSCAEDEIADTVSELTIVGGKVVFAAGDFVRLDDTEVPPAMPDWSPVRTFGGYAGWGDPSGVGKPALERKLAMNCGCANACDIHGHAHAKAWAGKLPIDDFKSFWGALGCACWAV